MSVGLFVGSRQRKRRQAAPDTGSAPVRQPAPVMQGPAPVRQAPLAAGGWQLAVVQGPGTGQRYALGQQARIGRSRDNEISLDDGQSSRSHAQVWQTPEGYAVQDTGSTNGTLVNGVRIQQPSRLAPGDRLQVGDVVLWELWGAGWLRVGVGRPGQLAFIGVAVLLGPATPVRSTASPRAPLARMLASMVTMAAPSAMNGIDVPAPARMDGDPQARRLVRKRHLGYNGPHALSGQNLRLGRHPDPPGRGKR